MFTRTDSPSHTLKRERKENRIEYNLLLVFKNMNGWMSMRARSQHHRYVVMGVQSIHFNPQKKCECMRNFYESNALILLSLTTVSAYSSIDLTTVLCVLEKGCHNTPEREIASLPRVSNCIVVLSTSLTSDTFVFFWTADVLFSGNARFREFFNKGTRKGIGSEISGLNASLGSSNCL